MSRKQLAANVGFFLWAFAGVALAQYGGRPGDAVIYSVTAKGSAVFQVLPPGSTNNPQSAAQFRIVELNTVPMLRSDPFPILRQTLYEQPDETFLVGNDLETSRGIHRLVLAPVKFLLKDGSLSVPGGLANSATFITFPPLIDVQGDISLENSRIIFWVPMRWPFLMPTDTQGPAVPPGMTGIELLLRTPGLIKILSLLPWVNLWRVYPQGGWPNGVDWKVLDEDPLAGDTIRLVRIRSGRSTPLFRTAGHTHFFVLQGSVQMIPAGSSPVTLNQNYYAFLPENFAVTLANPKKYGGPGAP